MDIDKQITYWVQGAENDIETADLLIRNKRLLHGLFFCHLVIEKIIKAHVVRVTHNIPPKSHNLLWLLEKTNMKLDVEDMDFLGLLMNYQLEGRYPEYYPSPLSLKECQNYLSKTKSLLKCLKSKL